jgi:hypothetical protein
MTHIMVDLETLSTHCNAAILAIGAVKFDAKRKVYDRFYQVVDTPPDQEGFDISSDTLHWWTKQSEEARAVFTDPSRVPITTALKQFFKWAMSDTEDVKDIRVWGNGAAFDNVILSTAYQLCDLKQPWMFWNDRCYRTMKNMNRTVGLTRIGTHHNAVDDAESQAVHLLAMEIELA